MTFQITPDECNRLIRSYQQEAANRPRALTSDVEERELLEAWRARIQQLAQHAEFLRSEIQSNHPIRKMAALELVRKGNTLEATGDIIRIGINDKPASLFQRGISARVLQGVKICDKCMRQLPQCVCHQSNIRGE